MWSPWRSVHIGDRQEAGADSRSDESVFSRLVRQDNDRENLILWRGQTVFVIMNLYPYNNGHVMIVPYREVANYEDLTAEEQVEIAHTIQRCILWIKKGLSPEGFNVGINLGKAAGAGIPRHLHVHVVPRWHGDTNFMPTIGEIKVVPEALAETYDKLCVAMTQLEDIP